MPKINLKIHNINFIIKELDNILTLYSYVKFLVEKRRQLKEENLMDYTRIDYLKNDIHELFIKIRIKSDKLADLINIRNLLVCIKEGILMKDLPLNFTFFNDNYKNILNKIYKSINNHDLKKNDNEKINSIIPKNLLESIYSKIIKEKKNINLNNRFKNYLKINYPIFKNEEDFLKCFREMESDINGFFIYILNQNYRKYESDSDPSLIKEENFNLIKNQEKEQKKKNLIEKLKQENIFLNIYYKKVLIESKKINYNKLNKNEDNNLKNLNKLLLESIINPKIAKDIKYIYNINQLKSEKKYKIKGAYIYHILMKNILEIYKKCPQYIIYQHNFQIEEFKFRINNFNNFIKTSSFQIIINEINYLLKIYYSSISYFFYDLNNLKNKQNEISVFNNIKDNIFNNTKKELFRFKIGLEEKIYNAKLEKICQKQNKNVIRRQNLYFPDIHFIKLKRNKSQEKLIDKNIFSNNNNIKFDYSFIKY